MHGVSVALDAGADLAESPVWDARSGVLWWIDIFRGEVHAFRPDAGTDEVIALGRLVGSLAIREGGGLLLALEDGFYVLEPGGGPQPFAILEADLPDNRFNDGRTDRQGRFWAGSLHRAETEPTGTLYRIDCDGTPASVADRIVAHNGVAFSPDGRTGYHADSRQRTVWAFDCDPETGDLSNRRIFLCLDEREGAPDGATVDAEGCYWLAQAGSWRIVRYRPNGDTDRVLQLPVQIPTSLTFGGPDMRTLFVTTAQYSLAPDELAIQPLAGSILALDAGIAGLPETPFCG